MTATTSVSDGTVNIVHIVDGDHRKRAAIASMFLESGGHAEIYEDLHELLLARPKDGAILMNGAMGSAPELLARLRDKSLFLPLILFTENPAPSDIMRAAHAGVADYLAWPFTRDELLSSCTYCQTFMEKMGSSILRRDQSRDLVAKLSQRERQILAFMLEGMSNKNMANRLELSPRTIEDYRLNAMRKLGVNATSAAVRIGLEAGLQNSGPARNGTIYSEFAED